MRRLLLAALLLLAGCSSAAGQAQKSGLDDRNGGSQYAGFALDPPQPRPSFSLIDTSGKKFDFGTVTQGHPTLLFFGYTNCPDVCPATMADIGVALRKQSAGLQRDTYVVFVSTDVKRDTAPVIQQWLKNFDGGSSAHFVGLNGSQAQIDAAQAASHIFLAEDDGQTHSAKVLLYGSDDYARTSFQYNDNSEQEQIAHDLPLVAG